MEVILTDRFLTRVEECTDYIALDHIPAAIQSAEGVFNIMSNSEQSLKVAKWFRSLTGRK